MSKPRKKKKKLLFAVEIIVLLIFIGGLYVYGQLNSKLEKIDQPVLQEEKIKVNPEVEGVDAEESKMTGYTTYALFGIDHRDKNAALGSENSDTIIIASVNNDTKDVKLVSVYRDTLLNLGDGTYSKANAAYAYGGPEQAITMLNTNLDLNITDYATVDFNALVTMIDLVGGLDIPMSYAEIVHMNNYCEETSKETDKDYTPIELPEPKPEDQEAIIGTYHLNGVQATSYCRIRYTASLDMGRTERQRRVIQMIVNKAKTAGLSTIFKIMDEVFPMVTTSLNKTQILQLIPSMIGYSVDDTIGFPQNYKFSNIKGSIIVPTTLESNVVELHKFLYGDEAYTPSAQVVANSQKILEIVGGEGKLEDTQTVNPDDENTNNDIIMWQENPDGGWNDVSDNQPQPEPDYTEPEPDYTEPEPTPDNTDPQPEPDYTDPEPTPDNTDPQPEPDYTEPEPEPDYTEPDYTEPDYTEPDYTEPVEGGGGEGSSEQAAEGSAEAA